MEDILSLEQWHELESRIRLQYPELTDDDLQYHEAVEEDLLKMVECSIRKVNDDIQGFIERHYRNSNLKYNWQQGRLGSIRKRNKTRMYT